MMNLTIELDIDVQARLEFEARRRGIPPAEAAKRLLEEYLPPHQPTTTNQSSLQLLAEWDKEDRTDDPAELERRRREWEELKQSLNQNRQEVGARKLFP